MRRITASAFLLILMLSVALIPSLVFASPSFTMGPPPEGLSNTDLTGIVRNITNWVLGFITIIAVLALIWGGVQYLTAAGDESQVETAKHIITYAIIGLVVVGISYAVVGIVVNCFIQNNC